MNAIHRYASRLPGSAGWVLLELLETPVNGIGQLMDALNLGERTIERAVADLAKLGLCVRDLRAVTLNQATLERCINPVQVQYTERSNPDATLEQAVNTSSTSLATELTPAVPDDANATPRVGVRGGFEFKPFAVEGKPTPNTKELKTPRVRGSSKPAKPPAEPKPPSDPADQPEPPARDAMFDAIAVATYGGVDGLTPVSCTLIGKAKKEFQDAKYSPEDVLSIGDFLRQRDPWRSQFTPRVLLEQAASWRNHDPKKPVQASSTTAPNRSGKPVNFRPGADEIAATIRAGSRFFGGGQAGNAPPTVNATSSSTQPALPPAPLEPDRTGASHD